MASISVQAKIAVAFGAIAIGSAMSLNAQAATIDWTQWNGNSGLAGNVTVTFTGNGNGIDHADHWQPNSTYTSTAVSNAPTTEGEIIFDGGNNNTQTFSFSALVTNPVMAIISLGGGGGTTSTYNFDQPFQILSTGPGHYSENGPFNQSGNALSGNGGNGTIQFLGTFSQITWTAPIAEHWQEFTIGVPVPEPSDLALFVIGWGALVLASRRARQGLVS